MLCALSVEVTGVATEKRHPRSSSKAAEWEAAESSGGEISGFHGVLYKFGMFLYESSISDETFYLLLRKQTDNLYITFFISHE